MAKQRLTKKRKTEIMDRVKTDPCGYCIHKLKQESGELAYVKHEFVDGLVHITAKCKGCGNKKIVRAGV